MCERISIAGLVALIQYQSISDRFALDGITFSSIYGGFMKNCCGICSIWQREGDNRAIAVWMLMFTKLTK